MFCCHSWYIHIRYLVCYLNFFSLVFLVHHIHMLSYWYQRLLFLLYRLLNMYNLFFLFCYSFFLGHYCYYHKYRKYYLFFYPLYIHNVLFFLHSHRDIYIFLYFLLLGLNHLDYCKNRYRYYFLLLGCLVILVYCRYNLFLSYFHILLFLDSHFVLRIRLLLFIEEKTSKGLFFEVFISNISFTFMMYFFINIYPHFL